MTINHLDIIGIVMDGAADMFAPEYRFNREEYDERIKALAERLDSIAEKYKAYGTTIDIDEEKKILVAKMELADAAAARKAERAYIKIMDNDESVSRDNEYIEIEAEWIWKRV